MALRKNGSTNGASAHGGLAETEPSAICVGSLHKGATRHDRTQGSVIGELVAMAVWLCTCNPRCAGADSSTETRAPVHPLQHLQQALNKNNITCAIVRSLQ